MSATLPCIDYGTVSRLQQTPAPTPTAPRWTANFDTSACVLATNGFIEVFDRSEAFRLNGVPLKRGIILHGAPGTGKTLLGKVLASLKLATFVYVTAADMSGLEGVRSIFDLARRLAPTILFFEDIDLFTDDRSSYCSKAMLGEILAQLDGFETNDGLIFIATTNDLAAIDPAIRERPSRFDVVIHIELPSRFARREILARNLPSTSADDTLLTKRLASPMASRAPRSARLPTLPCSAPSFTPPTSKATCGWSRTTLRSPSPASPRRKGPASGFTWDSRQASRSAVLVLPQRDRKSPLPRVLWDSTAGFEGDPRRIIIECIPM